MVECESSSQKKFLLMNIRFLLHHFDPVLVFIFVNEMGKVLFS